MERLFLLLQAVASISLLLLCGCSSLPSVGPNYKEPEFSLPGKYNFATEMAKPTSDIVTELEWWKQFGDPILNELVIRARGNNQDLNIAFSRIMEARARYGVSRAEFLPNIDIVASRARSETSQNGALFNSARVEVAPYTIYDAAFDARWEIDLFGGTRRDVEAATAELASSEWSAQAVELSIAAEVVRSYIRLRGFEQRKLIVEQNIRTQSENVYTVEQRVGGGLATELDAAQARAQLESTKSQLPLIETLRTEATFQLAILLGEVNQDFGKISDPSLPAFGAIPKLRFQDSVGIPSELLRERPDIRAAERSLAASTARVGVAISELFPSLTITGFLGVQSSESGRLDESDSRFWSFVPGVRWPIFAGGKIWSNVEVQRERAKQATFEYEKTVLQALSETEAALSRATQEQQRAETLSRFVAESQRAHTIAKELYSNGLTDFLRVLDTERSLFASQDQLAQNQQALAEAQVALFKALGRMPKN